MFGLPKLTELLEKQGIASKQFLAQFNTLPDNILFDYLQNNQLFSEQDLHKAILNELKLKPCDENKIQIDHDLKVKYHPIPSTFHPLFETQNHLHVGLSNPYIKTTIKTSKTIKPQLISTQFLSTLKNKSFHIDMNSILLLAAKEHSSDIHFFETPSNSCNVYFRIHGTLQYKFTCDSNTYTLIKQHIKLESKLDLGIYLTPQDGQMIFKHNSTQIDIRVSCLPTVNGEDIVCRLFNTKNTIESFRDLGIKPKHETLIKSICSHKAGLILVTGPTGSGKTTTLYTILRYLQTQARGTIITLEDPVEKQLSGLRQSSIKPEKNYTFATGLKAILRQDPDIIMVGEIRDKQTAELAIEAAYTGHLVLSTLHTHDVMSTIYRFKHFNCDPFLLNYVLKGIISQQLMPKKTNNKVTHRELNQEILYLQASIQTNIFGKKKPTDLGVFIQ